MAAARQDDHAPRHLKFGTLYHATKGFPATAILGSGATGEVYSGEIEGVPVAIKRLKLPAGSSEGARDELQRRFRAELAILASYKHPRIVRLLAWAENEDHGSLNPWALVFELLADGSLADWLKGPDGQPQPKGKAPLSALQRVNIALGTCAGLRFLHGLRDPGDGEGAPSQPVLHRDVKSANIGLGAGGYAKILDCGLAKATRGGAVGAAGAAAALGVSFTGGLVAGTAGYMAPEVVRAEVHGRLLMYMLCIALTLSPLST